MDREAVFPYAARVIEKCGGIQATAALVGRDRSVVNRWLLPKSKGGTGGLIPAEHQIRLMRTGKLAPDDFMTEPASPKPATEGAPL